MGWAFGGGIGEEKKARLSESSVLSPVLLLWKINLFFKHPAGVMGNS